MFARSSTLTDHPEMIFTWSARVYVANVCNVLEIQLVVWLLGLLGQRLKCGALAVHGMFVSMYTRSRQAST